MMIKSAPSQYTGIPEAPDDGDEIVEVPVELLDYIDGISWARKALIRIPNAVQLSGETDEVSLGELRAMCDDSMWLEQDMVNLQTRRRMGGVRKLLLELIDDPVYTPPVVGEPL